MMWNRMNGPYHYMYWALIFCNVIAPQALWFRKFRRNIPALFCMAMIVNVGMWLERYVIIVVSLSRDFLPSSWGMYHSTKFDWSMFVGSIGLFEDPTALVDATRRAREEGFTKLDAYSPYPIEALTEALDIHDRKLPAVVLGGGILGGLAGYALCYWCTVIEYPMNVGGKPFHSIPAFIVPTFETTILFAAFFNAPRFALASRDRFFLCIEAKDPKFDHDDTWAFLTKLEPRVVMDVEE